jgi:hypothetical protein
VTVHLLCLVIALVFAIAAALYTPPAPPRFSLGWAALAFLILSFIFP